MNKIPINKHGEGNCCPKCGSVKITMSAQYPLSVEIDLKTGKQLLYDRDGKRVVKPSNRLLAHLYRCAQMDAQLWVYSCRKCGWVSETFTQ